MYQQQPPYHNEEKDQGMTDDTLETTAATAELQGQPSPQALFIHKPLFM